MAIEATRASEYQALVGVSGGPQAAETAGKLFQLLGETEFALRWTPKLQCSIRYRVPLEPDLELTVAYLTPRGTANFYMGWYRPALTKMIVDPKEVDFICGHAVETWLSFGMTYTSDNRTNCKLAMPLLDLQDREPEFVEILASVV